MAKLTLIINIPSLPGNDHGKRSLGGVFDTETIKFIVSYP
jgi:hypothetical protein